jgi:hypothetical protein
MKKLVSSVSLLCLPRRSARDVGGSRGGQAPGSVQQRRQLGDAGEKLQLHPARMVAEVAAGAADAAIGFAPAGGRPMRLS